MSTATCSSTPLATLEAAQALALARTPGACLPLEEPHLHLGPGGGWGWARQRIRQGGRVGVWLGTFEQGPGGWVLMAQACTWEPIAP